MAYDPIQPITDVKALLDRSEPYALVTTRENFEPKGTSLLSFIRSIFGWSKR